MEYGFWSVVPALLTIFLAIVTKEVLLSIFIGVFGGCLIFVSGNPLGAFEKMVDIMINRLSDVSNIQVIVIVVLLGGLIGLLTRSGGSKAFADYLASKIKSRKGAQGATWMLGLLIFFDDYFNALLSGSIMRPVSDKYRVSREKLSYIIDSTAVGICLVVPVSSWVAFITALIGESYKAYGVSQDAFQGFLNSVPYNYYAWLSLIMVGIVIFLSLDFGPMAQAEKRTLETGLLCDHTFGGGDAQEDDFSSIPQAEGKVSDLAIPASLLILGTFMFMLYTGGFFYGESHFQFMNAVTQMNGTLALIYSILLSIVFSIIYFKFRKLSSIKESIEAFTAGTKSMVFVLILLVFAWAIGGISESLKAGEYVAHLLGSGFPGFLVPALIFGISCLMAFSTGASWGVYAILMPVAIPLAIAVNADISACIAAVIGGGGFGTHCSPLADTAILSSAGANIRHVDHIKTQIPYSVTCAIVAFFSYILSGIFKSPLIPLVICIGLFVMVVFILNKTFSLPPGPGR